MDIGTWLRELGLDRYEAAFRENEIDETVLPSLTLEDLKDMGVSLVGHRRKLLDAIAALRTEKNPKDAVRDEPPRAGAPARDSAERRQVTVMFSDLVGSTALSARMDPEDLREVITAYQQCVAEAVRRYGGFIAKYLGDGVLVYFGYPEAHEHDAERAVRAGLDVVAAVAGLQTRTPLQTRIGIATGLVVVGDLIGSGDAQERGIVGETPNLAARVQGIAAPNMVVVAEGTRRLIGNLFDLQDLGPQELKGIAGPVRAFAALRASAAESRFEAFHLTDLTAFVGREEETDILQRRWSRASAGEGQVVLISGEAGIGKSRLTAGLLERLANEQHIRLRYFCSPQDTNSALFPLIRHMERAAGFVHDDSPQAKLDKLGALLAKTSTSEQDLPLFAELLSVPNDGRYLTPALDAQQRRQKTLDALLAHIVTLSQEKPVLILFEDTHWIDPTTLELIGRTVDLIRDRRVLMIVTFRPEFEPPWTGRPHVATVTLNRLVQRDVDAMIDRIVGNKFIPASIRQDIIERTDGIPLFVEELTRAVLEAATEGEARQTVAAAPSPLVAVPATLQASLMARLDRLGPAKEIAQMGAAIGREFSHALIAAVARKSEVELEDALDRIIAAGLLFRQGTPPYAAYLFKHALVQDAAYGTLLREPRRALHARIVEAFESQFAEIVERQPELLARHCGEAGLIERAALLWGRAGQRSLERAAVAEAAEQLARALSQIASLPSTPFLRRERIKLQVAAANALMHVKGYAASETRGALDQARALIEDVEALGEPLDDPLLLFSVLYGLWVASYNTFDGNSVRERAAQFLAAAERQASSVPLMVGRRLTGISFTHTGDLIAGRAHLDDARRLYSAVEHRSLATRFGQDIGIGILFQRALPLWMLGYPETALADCDQAMRDARDLGLATTLMPALLFTSIIHILCGDDARAHEQANELVAVADEKHSALWKAFGTLLQGAVSALTGRSSEARQITSVGIGALRATGSTLWMPLWLSYLAKTYAALGQFFDAWRSIGEAMTIIETSKERLFEPEVNRMAGELALTAPAPDVVKAETYFQRALSISRGQQAKSWELRAAMSMARLWRDQGEHNKARELLAPVYHWFTEGLETRDLNEAKALLDSLTSTSRES